MLCCELLVPYFLRPQFFVLFKKEFSQNPGCVAVKVEFCKLDIEFHTQGERWALPPRHLAECKSRHHFLHTEMTSRVQGIMVIMMHFPYGLTWKIDF